MLGITDKILSDAEKKHPKLVIGLSGAVVMSILIMGGQLTYQWGQMDRQVSQLHDAQRQMHLAHGAYITRSEYQANNEALLREMRNIRQDLRDLSAQISRQDHN